MEKNFRSELEKKYHPTPRDLIKNHPDYVDARISRSPISSGLGRVLAPVIELHSGNSQVKARIAVDTALQDLANPPTQRHDELGA